METIISCGWFLRSTKVIFLRKISFFNKMFVCLYQGCRGCWWLRLQSIVAWGSFYYKELRRCLFVIGWCRWCKITFFSLDLYTDCKRINLANFPFSCFWDMITIFSTSKGIFSFSFWLFTFFLLFLWLFRACSKSVALSLESISLIESKSCNSNLTLDKGPL